MPRVALKLVEKPSFYIEDIPVLGESADRAIHSLHSACELSVGFPSKFATYFITRFSRPGDVVCDPFCGEGGVPLEAVLLGRQVLASHSCPLFFNITQSKLQPADITQVALWLQNINFKRPVALESFKEVFSPFYEVDTFRELLNLKLAIRDKKDRVSHFIQLITLSILHGHTAGYLSAYTSPERSLTGTEQERLNNRRGRNPDYRGVGTRVLRKAAFTLRDSIPSVLERSHEKAKVVVSDPRNLSFIASGTVDLILTHLPLTNQIQQESSLWLEYWFMGWAPSSSKIMNYQDWENFANEFLLEGARVVREGGRAVLVVSEVDSNPNELAEQLRNMIERNLRNYWESEGIMLPSRRRPQLKNSQCVESQSGYKFLILRRR